MHVDLDGSDISRVASGDSSTDIRYNKIKQNLIRSLNAGVFDPVKRTHRNKTFSG